MISDSGITMHIGHKETDDVQEYVTKLTVFELWVMIQLYRI